MSDGATDTHRASESDAPVSPERRRWDTLTPREQVIARALALGSRNNEISRQLEISIKTVDTHRAHALKKLGCRGNVDLARLAIQVGAVEAP